jgi:hypothetical protein
MRTLILICVVMGLFWTCFVILLAVLWKKVRFGNWKLILCRMGIHDMDVHSSVIVRTGSGDWITPTLWVKEVHAERVVYFQCKRCKCTHKV